MTTCSVLPSVPYDAVGPPNSIFLSRLNTQPTRCPVNASPLPSRTATHDSGPTWFATPWLGGTCTRETYRFVPAHHVVKILERPTGQQFEPSGLQMPVGPQGLDQGISLLGPGRPDHLQHRFGGRRLQRQRLVFSFSSHSVHWTRLWPCGSRPEARSRCRRGWWQRRPACGGVSSRRRARGGRHRCSVVPRPVAAGTRASRRVRR